MAARLNPAHDQRTRDKIKTSQLVNRLVSHVNGDCELSATQVRAAEILLRKTLPDLGSVELSGKDGSPIPVSLEVIFGRSEASKG